MTPSPRNALIIAILLACSLNVRGQTDSLALDSITNRIKEILEEYNSYTVFVDTSSYLQYEDEADNLNLQIAASLGACNEIIRLFIRGADVNNFTGRTARPLHYAVSSEKWEAVEILLLLGADPDLDDMYGNTPLITAVRANYLVIAEKLIRYGASVIRGDRHKSAPLHHAAALGNFGITDMLLYYDSPTELYDNEGNTPLMTGVFLGYHDIVDLLLQSGADPNTRDLRGYTPLMSASQKGDTLMMGMLIDAGADLYAVNNEGADALGCGVISSQKESVRYLLDKGNRWNTGTRTDAGAVNLANTFGQHDILRMMQDRGIEAKRIFSFNELSVSAGGLISPVYSMAGAAVSVKDPGMRTGITIGAAANPLNQRLLLRGDDDVYYQYQFRSTLICTGIFMEIPLSPQPSELSIRFVPSLGIGYRFHSLYEGTQDRPDDGFHLIPSADLGIGIRSLGLSAGLSYIRMPFYRAGPIWISLRAAYSFSRPGDNFSIKKLRLYNYEQN